MKIISIKTLPPLANCSQNYQIPENVMATDLINTLAALMEHKEPSFVTDRFYGQSIL